MPIALYFQDDLENEPEPEWYLEDLLPKGETVILFGPFGSRKSLIALDWANRIALNHGLVIYVTPEGFRGVKKRWAAWRAYHETERVERLALVSYAVQMRDAGEAHALNNEITAAADTLGENVSLIIIDTLARANAGGDENSAKDMTEWLHNVDQIRNAHGDECTMLVIHHDGNEKGRPRGSSAIGQWATFMLSAAATTGNMTLLKVEKAKDSEPITVTLRQVYMPEQDSVVVVEESRSARGDGGASRGPTIDGATFAVWIAAQGGSAKTTDAATHFAVSERTIRRWIPHADFQRHGIQMRSGEITLSGHQSAI